MTYYEEDRQEDIITREDLKIAISRDDAQRIMEIAADKLAVKLHASASKQISQKVDEAISNIITDAFRADLIARTQAAVDKFLVEPVAESAWRAGKEPKLLVDLVQPIVTDWLQHGVDAKGDEPSRYDSPKMTRFQYMTTKHVQGEVDKAIKRAVDEVTAAARAAVGKQVGAFVAQQLVPAFDLKALPSS